MSIRPHISVCVCTFRRPAMLERLLPKLRDQNTNGRFEFSIVVADNAPEKSALPVVRNFAAASNIAAVYVSEPEQNIARTRNLALRHATGDLVAFIDDDEFPEHHWLSHLFQARERYGVAGVLGPVRPSFERSPPKWVTKGRFCERAEFLTGRELCWKDCRTGNVLFEKGIVRGMAEPFDPAFGTGGEDKDFFMRMTAAGHAFRWCNEAVVYETVPPNRCTRLYMVRRALLRGRNILKLRPERKELIFRSVI